MPPQRRSRSHRPVGRPRADSRPVPGTPREAIVRAAADLFARHGYAGTTTAAIARAAGLRQSSLYYHFPTKQHVLLAVLRPYVDAPLATLEALRASAAPAPVKLYRFLRADAHQLCAAPADVNALGRLPEVRREAFREFWTARRRIVDGVADLVRAGVAEGAFREVDAPLAAESLCAAPEGAQNWFRTQRAYPAEQVADHLAEMGVRGLLRDPTAFDAVARAARDQPA